MPRHRTPLLLLLTALAAGAVHAATPSDAVRLGVEAWTRGDFASAVAQWQAPAAAGDADAQYDLGEAYVLGRGVMRDLPTGLGWFDKAARQGHVRAADAYGVLLFQLGRAAEAMPWLRQSGERGEPRALYLLAVSAYNGDFDTRDWTRAYALMSRAATAGMPQAISALGQMNATIPLAQRQQAQALAAQMEADAAATRQRTLASAELANTGHDSIATPVTAQQAAAIALDANAASSAASAASAASPALAAPDSSAGSGGVSAGADFARPVIVPLAPPRTHDHGIPGRVVQAPASGAPASGHWRVQLGAFAARGHADALWQALADGPLAGHPRIDVPAGTVSRLQAGGFASAADAQAACRAVHDAGHPCLLIAP